MWALQSAACSSCQDMLNRISSLEMDKSSINRLAALMELPQAVLQKKKDAKKAFQQRLATKIDQRIQA
jgi:hypothetical protein